MAEATQSLVRYDIPVLLNEAKKHSAGRKSVVPGNAAGPTAEDVLYSIMPPRKFEEDGQTWVQFVSNNPATRLDVINLQEQLDIRLQQRQARETGICPVREELYAQAFDELIRQVTVNCAERGLLLLRVRDEIRMTLAAYRTLYESAASHGMRKALLAEDGRDVMEATIRAHAAEKAQLQGRIQELEDKVAAVEAREEARRVAYERKHDDEVAFYRKTHQRLSSHLATLLPSAAGKA